MSRLLAAVLACGMAWAQTPASEPIHATGAADSNEEPSPPAAEAADLLPEVPAPPRGKATLLGGRLSRLDQVRDQLVVQPFGSGDVRILFDARTQVFRDGLPASPADLRRGDKIYVDTVLDGTRIFAKTIRVLTQRSAGESRGQIVGYDQSRGELVVNDPLSPERVTLHLSASTKVLRQEKSASLSDLRPGALVDVKFQPQSESRAVASEISILAEPGSDFTFAGRVTHVDMHSGLLVLLDPRDRKTYEVHFDPSTVRVNGDLREGSEVTVKAGFDGARYATNTIDVNSASSK
jgi:hypothetical protein